MNDQASDAPMAMCPSCGEVLVCTIERSGKEFLCLGCGRWWEWLQPRPEPSTPGLEARAEALRELFIAGARTPAHIEAIRELGRSS